jgi:hypothetical protein
MNSPGNEVYRYFEALLLNQYENTVFSVPSLEFYELESIILPSMRPVRGIWNLESDGRRDRSTAIPTSLLQRKTPLKNRNCGIISKNSCQFQNSPFHSVSLKAVDIGTVPQQGADLFQKYISHNISQQTPSQLFCCAL